MRTVLWLLLLFFLVLVIVFAVLSFGVHHLFLIAQAIAAVVLLTHGGLVLRHSRR